MKTIKEKYNKKFPKDYVSNYVSTTFTPRERVKVLKEIGRDEMKKDVLKLIDELEDKTIRADREPLIFSNELKARING